MAFHKSSLAVALAFAVVMPLSALAQSQTTPPQPSEQQPQATQPSEQQSQAAQPSDEQLKAFVAATVRIAGIQREAQQRMQTAVQEEGLTPEEYTKIAKLAQSDAKLSQTLNKMIEGQLKD